MLNRANELKEYILATRRSLHQIPELGLSLPKTSAFVKAELEKLGLDVKRMGESGLTATIQGGFEGKTLLLRADMDALPMKEASGLDFAAKGKCAHACGHDLHTAMLLAAAKILVEQKDMLHGNVKLMFQPAEEIFKGSKMMIENGILDGVDAALAMHTELADKPGTIYYYKGYMTSSCDNFKIDIVGKGTHGAYPHMGVDPINAAVCIYQQFNQLVARDNPPTETTMLTFGQLSAGNSSNIVPETAVLQGTMRSFSPEVREKLKKRMLDIVEGVATLTNCSITLDFFSGVPSLYSDPNLTNQFIDIIKAQIPEINIVGDHRIMASEDMSDISVKVPTCYIMLDCKQEGQNFAHHNPAVIFNEDAMPYGATIFASIAMEWLK